jgi:hypothetical protein
MAGATVNRDEGLQVTEEMHKHVQLIQGSVDDYSHLRVHSLPCFPEGHGSFKH